MAISEYEIKIINNEQVKIHPKNSITYSITNIELKELRSGDMEFHTYNQSKKEASNV